MWQIWYSKLDTDDPRARPMHDNWGKDGSFDVIYCFNTATHKLQHVARSQDDFLIDMHFDPSEQLILAFKAMFDDRIHLDTYDPESCQHLARVDAAERTGDSDDPVFSPERAIFCIQRGQHFHSVQHYYWPGNAEF